MGFTLKEIAELTCSDLYGDPDFMIEGVEDLTNATSTHLSFVSSRKHVRAFKDSKAGAFIVSADILIDENRNFLVNCYPTKAFQLMVTKLVESEPESGFSGIHPTSVIHETTTIGKNVTIGPFAVIDRDCVIADGSTIGANTFIGQSCELGNHCHIYERVTLHRRSKLGNRVVIQSGTVIGGCGFRHQKDENEHSQTVPHHGNVVIEDDVEIGSNTNIDRGLFSATRIGKRSKIDSLIMIAHNVQIGHDVVIIAQSGIAGSSKIGNHSILAAQVGIADHVTLENKVILGARAGVRSNIEKSGVYSGVPLQPYNEYLKTLINIRNLNKLVGRLKNLETRVKTLTSEEISCS